MPLLGQSNTHNRRQEAVDPAKGQSVESSCRSNGRLPEHRGGNKPPRWHHHLQARAMGVCSTNRGMQSQACRRGSDGRAALCRRHACESGSHREWGVDNNQAFDLDLWMGSDMCRDSNFLFRLLRALLIYMYICSRTFSKEPARRGAAVMGGCTRPFALPVQDYASVHVRTRPQQASWLISVLLGIHMILHTPFGHIVYITNK